VRETEMARSKPLDKSAAGNVGKCPICGRASDAHYRPFCSRRCADVDLSRWLSGGYAIPVREDEDEDGDRSQPSDPGSKDDSGRAH
jgi:endogenous inhibitor of DNA gyrase (YacG/DUF329 family)